LNRGKANIDVAGIDALKVSTGETRTRRLPTVNFLIEQVFDAGRIEKLSLVFLMMVAELTKNRKLR